ncbi:MAG: phosphohistidine phosphatase SixA [Desulfovibrio sp.]|nr:MAG: phosphohistidine phosphatase SixA [Desulfovibrio sp.]
MLLYLMQHGASFSKDIDPEEPLSPLGRESVERSCRAMAALSVRPELILASPKLRSRQTAALVAKALNYPETAIVVTESVKAMASPGLILEDLAKNPPASVLIAGHLPHVAKLAAKVCTSGGAGDFVVENSGLTLVQVTNFAPLTGKLLWHAPPQVLHLVGA